VQDKALRSLIGADSLQTSLPAANNPDSYQVRILFFKNGEDITDQIGDAVIGNLPITYQYKHRNIELLVVNRSDHGAGVLCVEDTSTSISLPTDFSNFATTFSASGTGHPYLATTKGGWRVLAYAICADGKTSDAEPANATDFGNIILSHEHVVAIAYRKAVL
jgi:hypothetical protein